jgi:hypothetical protein
VKSLLLALILFSGIANAVHSSIRYHEDGNWYCRAFLGIGQYTGLEARTFEFAKLYQSQAKEFDHPKLFYLKKTRDVMESFGFAGEMLAGVWLLDVPQEVVAQNFGTKVAESFAPLSEKFIVLKLAQRIAFVEDLMSLPREYWPQLALQDFVLEQQMLRKLVKIPAWGKPVLARLNALILDLAKKMEYQSQN